MDITVRDFLSKAYSKKDGIAIRDCNGNQEPQFMAVMTARESWGDYIVDSFTVDRDLYGHDKVPHLWVYKED